MVDSRITNALTYLGLTRYEAEVYITLVELGEATVREIADKSTVPREKVYQVLRKLSERGLARLIGKNPIKYMAVSPRTALREKLLMWRNQVKSVESAIDILEEKYSSSKSKIKRVNLSFWEITQKVEDNLLEFVERASRSLDAILTAEESVRVEERWFHVLKKLAKRDVEVRIFAPLEDANVESLGRLSNVGDVRVIEEVMDYSLYIVDGEAGFLVGNEMKFGIHFIDRRFCEAILRLVNGSTKIPGGFENVIRLIEGRRDVYQLISKLDGHGVVRGIIRKMEEELPKGDEEFASKFSKILLEYVLGDNGIRDLPVSVIIDKISSFASLVDDLEYDVTFDEDLNVLSFEISERSIRYDLEELVNNGHRFPPNMWLYMMKKAISLKGYVEGPTIIHYDTNRGVWKFYSLFEPPREGKSRLDLITGRFSP